MLRLRRRPVKTRARLAKEELSEGFDHLVQAANHAAGGVGATVGPRVHAARDRMAPAAGKVRNVAVTGLGTTAAALTPLAVAAREGSRLAKRRTAGVRRKETETSSGRWPKMALLAAGAAVGLVGAMAMRRRRQRQWDEYDPSRPPESGTDQVTGALDRATDSASTTAETLAEKAASAIGSAAPPDRVTPAPAPAPMPIAAPAPDLAATVPVVESPSSNRRS